MGAGVVQGIFSLLIFWATAIVVSYAVVKVRAPTYASATLLFSIVGLPLIVVVYGLLSVEIDRRKQEAQEEQREAGKYPEYTNACHTSEMEILDQSRPAPSSGVVLLENSFYKGSKGAQSLGICLFAGDCTGSKIGFYEARFNNQTWFKYSKAPEQSAFSSQKFLTYTEEQIPVSTAKYGLILGAANDPQTLSANGGYRVEKSTIGLVRLSDNKRIAQTSVYFLNSNSGLHGCPEANREISKMLAAVFK